jgi:hypothetical protein
MPTPFQKRVLRKISGSKREEAAGNGIIIRFIICTLPKLTLSLLSKYSLT